MVIQRERDIDAIRRAYNPFSIHGDVGGSVLEAQGHSLHTVDIGWVGLLHRCRSVAPYWSRKKLSSQLSALLDLLGQAARDVFTGSTAPKGISLWLIVCTLQFAVRLCTAKVLAI